MNSFRDYLIYSKFKLISNKLQIYKLLYFFIFYNILSAKIFNNIKRKDNNIFLYNFR